MTTSKTDSRTLIEALDGLHFAMVATAGADGKWASRPLAVVGTDGGTLRFLVSTDADWVAGLEATSSPTTVTFSDPGKNTYVGLQGAARTTNDRAQIAGLWDVGAAAYFEGKDDPKVRVLEVDVHYGEYWDGPHGKLGQALNLAKAALGNKDAGEQGDVVV